MNDLLKKLSGNSLLMFGLIFVTAIVFLLFKIGLSDMWSDEIYTKTMLQGPLSDLYPKFRTDLHPPLYYLGLRLFSLVFGMSAISMRVFSVIGVLSALLLIYFAGQRIFGRQGALLFCLMLISIPMLAIYSHQARMYTWAAFSVTGVFIYAYLFIMSGTKRDLIFLFIFTLAAMYIHYYSLAAAFVANIFVFFYLLLTKNRNWIRHLIVIVAAALLYLPWLPMFLVQIKRVQTAFWAPEVSPATILSCFSVPFTEHFWTSPYSKILTILMHGLVLLTIIMSFRKSFSEYRLAIWLSLSVFLGTLLLSAVISLLTQPVFYYRYVVVIIPMLAILPTILLIKIKLTWLRIILIVAILFLGIRTSVSSFAFSYGPYKQTIDYIAKTYPAIKKVLHITEVTAGPLMEYTGNSGLTHYWLKAKMSNVDAFTAVHQFSSPGEFLQPGEIFCVARFHNLELNLDNLDRVLSESQQIRIDTVRDNKFKNGVFIRLYILKYKGEQSPA
jgi:4-amino-4-deoxy-L-arabinose transferase-like glycosyltransferase